MKDKTKKAAKVIGFSAAIAAILLTGNVIWDDGQYTPAELCPDGEIIQVVDNVHCLTKQEYKDISKSLKDKYNNEALTITDLQWLAAVLDKRLNEENKKALQTGKPHVLNFEKTDDLNTLDLLVRNLVPEDTTP